VRMIKKQVVWGQEFTGQPFLSKPEQIELIDFEVGKWHKTQIVSTNVSLTLNTF